MSNLRVGSIIEVECDRYWCIAEILEVLENGSYKVKYEGWDSSYDEIVTFDRMAPLGTGVYKYTTSTPTSTTGSSGGGGGGGS
jgi:uncharacterized membrane protein